MLAVTSLSGIVQTALQTIQFLKLVIVDVVVRIVVLIAAVPKLQRQNSSRHNKLKLQLKSNSDVLL